MVKLVEKCVVRDSADATLLAESMGKVYNMSNLLEVALPLEEESSSRAGLSGPAHLSILPVHGLNSSPGRRLAL
ncbi:MAG: hypothetical protein PVJ42_06475, partial [bacterium]